MNPTPANSPLWTPSTRYPDPRIRTLDPRFQSLTLPNASVEQLSTGQRWGEGPVWFGDHRCLLWSDIPNDRVLRWDEQTGATSVFRQPSGHANGAARDLMGRYIACENDRHAVTRTEHDGTITILADEYDGTPLNSPNDVVVKSDGSIWFTDPPFGIASWYEGVRRPQELPARVYRIDPKTLDLEIIDETSAGPNGLAFSPDESLLYVVESRGLPHRRLRRFEVSADGRSLHHGTPLIDCGEGTSDGIAIDEHGNIWAGWGMGTDELDGVRVFGPDGTPLGHISLPERCANLCFGGRHGNRLFMACGHSLYSVYLNVSGADWRDHA